jgi:AcrR family transcriptional regulator
MIMDINNPKFISIVSKAKELFWKHGIRRVSIEEICKEAGVSKMTFYKFFKNKSSLVISIFETLTRSQMQIYRDFWESDCSMEEKVQKTIELKLENSENVSMEFIHDILKSGDKELLEYFNQRSHEALDMVRYDYRDAQEKGLIRQDLSIGFIMYMMNHIGEMMVDEKLASQYTDGAAMLRDLLEFFFYGIMPKK